MRTSLLLSFALALTACTAPIEASDDTAPGRDDSGAAAEESDHSLEDDDLFDAGAPLAIELATSHRQVIYINFDGPRVTDCSGYCSDAHNNRSWAMGAHFGENEIDFASYGGSSADRSFIVNHITDAFEPYEIDVVTARPSSAGYTMLIISPSTTGPAHGVSPLDCDNRNPNDIAFVYKIGGSSRQWIAQAGAHELGHSFGLTHVTNSNDYLHWNSSGDAFTRANYDHGRAPHTCTDGDVQDAPAMLQATLGSRTEEPIVFNGTFADDDGSVHENNIEKIYANGITVGCKGGDAPRFCPEESVTRAQMVTFLGRALNLPKSNTDWFSDDDGAWWEGPANSAADAGITSGCGGDRFCGPDPVSRAQMAAFLARALDLPASSKDWFTDDDGNAHENAINAVADAGITVGCGTDKYCPNDDVTRAQMATFLTRALGL